MQDNQANAFKGNALRGNTTKESMAGRNTIKRFSQKENSRDIMHRATITVETLQRAIVLAEILGRPVSKRRRVWKNGNQNHVGRR